jgi:hypothetical protein
MALKASCAICSASCSGIDSVGASSTGLGTGCGCAGGNVGASTGFGSGVGCDCAVDENTKLSLRARMYKELAQYAAFKRKAIEAKGKASQSFIDAIREANSRRDIPDHDVLAIVQDIFFTSRGDW